MRAGHTKRQRTGGATIAVAAVALLAFAPGALAKTYKPTRTDDPAPNGCKKHNCSLREAVISANAHSGSDKIQLTKGKTYRLSHHGSEPFPSFNAPGVNDLDINGPLAVLGTKKKAPTIDAKRIDRVFTANAKSSFRYLRIVHGYTLDAGGAIFGNGAPVSVSDCKIYSNRNVSNQGGALSELASTMSVKRSTVSNNRGAAGGGIAGYMAHLRIDRSTISGNSADYKAGGIEVDASTLKLTSSTVANNRAGEDGGGILANPDGQSASVNIVASTIVGNKANNSGGGGYVGGGFMKYPGAVLSLRNVIVAGNTNPGGSNTNCFGYVDHVAGVNLFPSGNQAECPTNSGTTLYRSSLHLGSLKTNGGPTKTIALKRHSPAVNRAGKAGEPRKDQRGVKRDKHPDIGAFEYYKKK